MSSANKLTGVVVDIVRSDDGVVRLLPADRQLIPDTVSERQRLRLPEGQHTTAQQIQKQNRLRCDQQTSQTSWVRQTEISVKNITSK